MTRLLELPAEILSAICRELCPHCVSKGSPLENFMNTDLNAARDCLASLSHLSRTCKTLRVHSQPVLYHCPLSCASGLASLVRTLAEHPELGQQVVELYLGGLYFPSISGTIPPDDIAICNNLMATHTHDADGEPIIVSQRWPLQDRPATAPEDATAPEEGEIFEYAQEYALAALILTQTPNLERLRVETYYNSTFPFCQRGSLPRLTELRLQHGDTEMGVSIDTVRGILLAAPALESFSGHMIRGVSESVSHDNIRKVDLNYSAMDSEDFANLMRGFRKLETFSYYSGGSIVSDEGEATPQEISQAVLIRRKTLRHLCIDYTEAFFPDGLDEGDEMAPLKDMEVLETLDVDGNCIYVETEDETTTDGSLLIEFLPASLQKLTIRMPHDHIFADILNLGKAAPEKFPKLKEVCITGLDSDTQGALKTILEVGGIKASFKKDHGN
ncbi:hypothetical protein G7046_g5253 [Stylonectria norvegica]|nr:hypothetical protein G7046_g5253 [Stylonectria norvegica]